ncbi:MAG: ATP-binding protein, partial [Rhizobiales bacterium]|nr:ATP-binding protein [Hyphomicrobiales bacterium]
LGLSIVKSFVELHDGAIALDSQIDTGTTITLTLPKTGPQERVPADAAVSAPLAESPRLSVG